MRFGPPSALHSQLMLMGCGSSGGGTSIVWPLDVVSGALAAWGLVPLSAAKVGANGFELQKTSGGAQQDFVFEDANTPIATVDAWKGADAAWNNRAASFRTIYDQVGTNNITQTTQNDQPSWFQRTDGAVVAAMDGNTLARNAFWNIPNMSLNGRNVTVYHVFRSEDRTSSITTNPSTQMHPAFGWLVTGGYAGLVGSESPAQKVLARTWRGGSFDDTYVRPSNAHTNIMAMRWNGTNTRYTLNDAVVSTTGIQVNDTFTSGAIGKLATFGIYSPACQWLATLIYPAQSDAEMTATMAALRSRFNQSAWTHNVVFLGDSITAGHAEDQGFWDVRSRSWPTELHASMGNPALRFTNVAVSSQTLATLETNAVNTTDAHYSASVWGANNILWIFAGTNDINAGADGATAISRLTTLFNNRRTAGWNKIGLCTAIPREPFNSTQNTHLATYNAFITANSLGADAVVDLAALSWSYGTHYQGSTPNRIHPSAAGRTLIVNAVKPALQSML